MEHTIKRGSTYYYRRRIPLDLVAAHGGKAEVMYSLRTKDRAEAECKARRASVVLDDEWSKMRAGTVPPERIKGTLDDYEQAEYEHHLGAAEDERTGAESEAPLSKLRIAGVVLPQTQQTNTAERVTLDQLVEHWERERKPNTKTVAKMKTAALGFNLLHKDPAVQAITPRMVIEYRTHLLGTGKAKGTIDDRLSNIGTLLALAVDHSYVAANVAARAALPPDKLAAKPRIGYTPAQAAVVMAGTEEFRESAPARYWLPRLARWTGARLNELHPAATARPDRARWRPGSEHHRRGRTCRRRPDADEERSEPPLGAPASRPRGVLDLGQGSTRGAVVPGRPRQTRHRLD